MAFPQRNAKDGLALTDAGNLNHSCLAPIREISRLTVCESGEDSFGRVGESSLDIFQELVPLLSPCDG